MIQTAEQITNDIKKYLDADYEAVKNNRPPVHTKKQIEAIAYKKYVEVEELKVCLASIGMKEDLIKLIMVKLK